MGFGFILLAIVLLGLGGFATFELRSRSKQTETPDAIPSETTNTTAETTSWTNLWRGKQADVVPMLRAWVADNVKDKKVKDWVDGMSDDDLKILAGRLGRFSEDANFDLLWLLEKDVEHDSQLTKELTSVVTHQLQAYYISDQISDDVSVFQMYHTIKENPGRNQKRLQTLYTELVSQNVSDAPSPEMVLASGTDRQDYLLKQVEEAADKDWKKFAAVLAQLMEKEAEERKGQSRIATLERLNPLRRKPAQPDAAADTTTAAPDKAEPTKATKAEASEPKKPADSGNKPSASPA